MNLEKFWKLLEADLAAMDTEQLYLLQGILKDQKAVAQYIDQIHRMICYRENRSQSFL